MVRILPVLPALKPAWSTDGICHAYSLSLNSSQLLWAMLVPVFVELCQLHLLWKVGLSAHQSTSAASAVLGPYRGH